MSWGFFLQDGGVIEGFTHKMTECEFCLQNGGVSESYPQDGGMEVLPTRWRRF